MIAKMKSIMVIEDSQDLRDLYAIALESAGVRSTLVENAKLALEILKNAAPFPDVILVDLHLPEMNGADFVRAARTLPGGAQARFIIASGADDLQNIAAECGANGYLRKPFSLRAIEKLCEE